MRQEFMDWVMEKVAKPLVAEEKDEFVRMLKIDPESMRKAIEEEIPDWAKDFIAETGIAVEPTSCVQEDARQVLVAFQKYFAEKMATIPEEPATVQQ